MSEKLLRFNASPEWIKERDKLESLGEMVLKSASIEVPIDVSANNNERNNDSIREPSLEEEPTTGEKDQLYYNKGVRFIIVGPPHSGKSVFVKGLEQCLDTNETFSFQANPDGETRGIYDDPETAKTRQKGEYTESFIEKTHDILRDWEGPIMLADFGGNIDVEEYRQQKIRMLEDTPKETYAIILSGSNDGRDRDGDNDKPPRQALIEMKKWEDFLAGQGIKTIAKIHSDYQGKEDFTVNNGENGIFKGSVHRLERGEPAFNHETVQRVAGLIQKIANEEARLPKIFEKEGSFIVATNHITESISHKIRERTYRNLAGELITDGSPCMTWSGIPELYKRAHNYTGRPVYLNGAMSGWGAMALGTSLKEAGATEVYLSGRDGYVKTKSLPMETDRVYDPEWWSNPVRVGTYDGKPVVQIDCNTNTSTHRLNPEDLDNLKVPKVPENAIVVVSTSGANWLKTSIAMSYQDKVAAIISRSPKKNSPCIWAKDQDLLGACFLDGSQGEIDFMYPEPTLEQYLAMAKHNLATTSRTANGELNTSASKNKADAMAVDDEEQAAKLAEAGFEKAIRKAYDKSLHKFKDPAELRVFIEDLAMTVNEGILKDGVLIRSGEDSTKHPYTRIADLPAAMDRFYTELAKRMSDRRADPIETAAFAEYTIDLADHFFADGCGKVAKVVSSFILMRAGLKLPDYSRGGRTMEETRKEYYSFAPKTIPGEDPVADQQNYDNFVNYYRSLFSNVENLITERHSEQTRSKGTEPYTTHLFGVANVLDDLVNEGGEITNPTLLQDLRDAALGHDLLEDTATTPKEVFLNSNQRVLKLIRELTNPQDDAHTKQYMQQLKTASEEGRLVKYADLIENTSSVIHDYGILGPEWTKGFYLPIMENTLTTLNSTIFTNYPKTAKRAREILQRVAEDLRQMVL